MCSDWQQRSLYKGTSVNLQKVHTHDCLLIQFVKIYLTLLRQVIFMTMSIQLFIYDPPTTSSNEEEFLQYF